MCVWVCVMVALNGGCEAQQTHIVSTVRYPDGTEHRYANLSSGYGYNPNVTVDVSARPDSPMIPRLPARPAATTATVPSIERYGGDESAPRSTLYPAAAPGGAVSSGGWGYGGPYSLPASMLPAPVIVPVYTGGYWGQSPWSGSAWGAGVPWTSGTFGAGVYGPPLPGTGVGCR